MVSTTDEKARDELGDERDDVLRGEYGINTNGFSEGKSSWKFMVVWYAGRRVEGEEKDGAHVATSSTSARTEGEGRLVEFTISNLDGEVGRIGKLKVRTHPEWAPIGVERFHELVETGFWNNCKFFRVVPDFVDQIGISGDPQVQKQWRSKVLKDDPVLKTNARGTLTFATSGKDTRTTRELLEVFF